MSFGQFVHDHPVAVFVDHTYLGNTSEVADVINDNSPVGYVPVIDFDEEFGFVYHTLLSPDGTKSRKNIAERFERNGQVSRVEADIEGRLFNLLKEQGSNPVRQFHCSGGIADIVTDDAIIEVKALLDRRSVISAIGQVFTYRQCIVQSLKPFIAGKKCKDFDAEKICKPIGIGVIYTDQGDSL